VNNYKNGFKTPSFDLNDEVHIELKEGCALIHPSIVRMKGNEFFILGHPPSDPMLDRIKRNDFVRVRYLTTKPFRFQSRVLHMVREPNPLLFLRYPQFIEQIERRDSERKKVFLHGELISQPGDLSRYSTKGYLLDISETGCQIWGDFLHLLKNEAVLTFRAPWTGDNIQTEVRVVRCGLTDMGLCVGLKFINMDTAFRNRVRACIGRLSEDHIARFLRKYLPTVNADDVTKSKEIHRA
jgi:hypothetical protein